jgi:alkylation response protein AidB-like acyl-CoA dehydrogenase
VVLAANLIQLAGDPEDRERFLPGLASGDVVGTAAVLDGAGVWNGTGAALSLARAEGTVSGTASFVLEGGVADLIVVVAADDEGRALLAVPADQAGVTATSLPGLDTTRNLATISFDAAMATVLCTGDKVDEVLAEVESLALAALCAEMVGGAAKVLEATVEYAKIREQFGVPIGSFQAIKFKCADMLLQLEAARSASLYASNAVATGAEDRAISAEAAKAVCSDAYFAIAAESVQIHGGIGFTWEHDTHLYFKRAKASELLLGNGDLHRERIATRLGW